MPQDFQRKNRTVLSIEQNAASVHWPEEEYAQGNHEEVGHLREDALEETHRQFGSATAREHQFIYL